METASKELLSASYSTVTVTEPSTMLAMCSSPEDQSAWLASFARCALATSIPASANSKACSPLLTATTACRSVATKVRRPAPITPTITTTMTASPRAIPFLRAGGAGSSLVCAVSEIDVGGERLPGGVLTAAPDFDGQLYAQEPDLRLVRDGESRRTVVSTPARGKLQSVRGNRINERLSTAALGTFQIVAAEIIAYDFRAVDPVVSPGLVAEGDAGCRRHCGPCGIRGVQKQVSPRGVRCQVVRIGGPDLTFHPAKGEPGIPDGLEPVAAVTEGPYAHIEDRIQGEEHAEHHHGGDEYLHERETRFLLPRAAPCQVHHLDTTPETT